MVDSVARDKGINRDEFGKFIEDYKSANGRGGSDNLTYEELQDLAELFKSLGGRY